MSNNTDNELDVNEWIGAMQDDLDTISLVSQVPVVTSACYHCEQAVEKILKAYLIAKENKLTKTHDLNVLLNDCEKYSSDFGNFKFICSDITAYATVRYPPGRNLTVEKMKQAVKGAYEVVDFTMSKLKELGYDKPTLPIMGEKHQILGAKETD